LKIPLYIIRLFHGIPLFLLFVWRERERMREIIY